MKRNKPSPFSVSVVIPTYNNAHTATEQLLSCLHILQGLRVPFEILISDDQSTDGNNEILKLFQKEKGVTLYEQNKRLGIAANLRFLYTKARKEYVLIYSIDGDWNPLDIKKLIQKAKKTKADIVIGERLVKEYPLSRKIVSALYNGLPVLLFNVKTYDAGSIKIFRRSLFQNVRLLSQSVNFEAEMIIRAAKNDAFITAIPVSFKKHQQNKKSSVNYQLIISSFLDMIKLRLKL